MKSRMIRCMTALVMLIYIITAGLSPPAAEAAARKVSSSAAIVIEASTGRVLFADNADERMPMASTTKIMTALVALENGKLSDTVKIPNEAVGVEGSSIYLKKGEKLKLEELLYGLMLSSGNDASVAIACHVGGSVKDFVQMMNDKAKALGLKNTHFVNPNGLPAENHYTSAYDLAVITKCAMANPVFRRICQTKYKEISGPEGGVRTLKNKNKILWQYEGGNGVKTGYTKAAGKCLVSAALREDMQLICVVLNSSSMFEQSIQLLDAAFKDFDLTPVLSEGEPLGNIPVKRAELENVTVDMDQDVLLPLTEEEQNAITVKVSLVSSLRAPVRPGTQVGRIEVFIGEYKAVDMDILLHQGIPAKTLGDWLSDILESIF